MESLKDVVKKFKEIEDKKVVEKIEKKVEVFKKMIEEFDY